MQCPRCGLQNLPDITACARCGLPVRLGPVGGPPLAGPGAAPGPGPTGSTAASAAHPSDRYGQGRYGPPEEYGAAPAGPSYGQQPSPPYSPGASPHHGGAQPPYAAPYGTNAGSPYATGPIAPITAYAPAPPAHRTADGDAGGSRNATAGLVRLVLLLGVLASVGYAGWAFTLRRGIFADFAANRTVSLDDAKTSDRLDTIFLVVAGAVAVIALAVWVVRLLSGRSRSGALTVIGLAVSVLGLVCVVVGLVLSGLVGDGGDRIAESEDAVTATIVTGSGFVALAIGLLIGCLVAKSRPGSAASAAGQGGAAADTSRPQDMVTGPAGW